MTRQTGSDPGTPRVILGERPRPRALALGFSEKEVALLDRAFPTVRAIRDLPDVAQVEWDVLVTRLGAIGVAPHLFVLGFADVTGDGGVLSNEASRNFGRAEFGSTYVAVQYDELTKASQVEVPAGLPPLIHRLAVEQLAPAAKLKSFQLVLRGMGPRTAWGQVSDSSMIRPFLLTSEGTIIAGSFRRHGGIADCWCLPAYLTDLVPWAQAARTEWEGLAPDRFPRPAPWMRRDEWRTPTELHLLQERTSLEEQKTAYLATLQSQVDNIDARIADAADAADAAERHLLTAQGDALKRVVSEALQALGFLVDDMDLVWPAGDRLEDLRVRDPDNGSWVCLVEVRGYKRGAQLADLMRMQRFGSRHQQEAGRMPDRFWFVTNHDIDQDPSERMPALASNPNEVQTFAESGGLVIDTVELFRISQAADAGRVNGATARGELMKATGRFSASSVMAVAGAISEQPTK